MIVFTLKHHEALIKFTTDAWKIREVLNFTLLMFTRGKKKKMMPFIFARQWISLVFT